ncbi:MAG: LCP family protein [Patescibacteria group bacterium]|jgi:LCP family protein required for cell wall assembly
MLNDIDLLDQQLPQRQRPKKIFKSFSYLIAILIIILFTFTSKVLMSEDNSIIGTFSFLGQIKHLAQTSDNLLKGEENDRINILLLGMGGKKHEGGYLTDTIMLVSIKPSSGDIAMLSIPRDLSIPVEGYGWRKINNINAFAEVEEEGSGGLAASQALNRVLDLPIDYYIRVDFEGFEKIIDEIGGIEVDVENIIDDYRYPVLGMEDAENYDSRYQHLYIEPGLQKMDGEMALRYARSRHSAGVEGTDFARSRRQQKVLQAAKEKILNMHIIFKPRLITNILETFNEHVSTNLKVWEIVKLWDITKNTNSGSIVNKVLDNSQAGLLMDYYTEEGAYILQPRNGDFQEIQYLTKNLFNDAPPQEKKNVIQELAKIEIQNGTWVNGLGQRVATDLEKYGFEIIGLNNASKQNYEQSIIFDLSYGEKMNSLSILKEKTNARINYGLPEWLIEDLAAKNAGKDAGDLVQPDFILILGQDADKTKSGIENEEE